MRANSIGERHHSHKADSQSHQQDCEEPAPDFARRKRRPFSARFRRRNCRASSGVMQRTVQGAFAVIDSGNGVPPELKARIMEPFFTTKPVGKGTGLGLSLSKAIVVEHGGELKVSEVENHTCFSFFLPLIKEA